eukprot:GHVU01028717.1.p1 GENE.GHVU01028717.1~~GHVU01028717.1.p1  ORF type:complete len:901 (-),score=85.38 GHVU01028717.1:1944-4646(-)
MRLAVGTACLRLGVNEKFWPVVLPGVSETHNKTCSATDASPFRKRFGLSPKIEFLLGDPVYLRLPISTKLPKPVGLPGVTALYLSSPDPSTAILYCAGRPEPIIRVHPSAFRHANGGNLSLWKERFATQKAGVLPPLVAEPTVLPHHPHLLSDHARSGGPSRAGYADDSDDSEDPLVTAGIGGIGGEAPIAVGGGAVGAVIDAGGPRESDDGGGAVGAELEAGGPRESEDGGGESVATSGDDGGRLLPSQGRPTVGQGVLAYDHDSLLRAAVVIESRPSTAQVGWLQEQEDGTWETQYLADVRHEDIEAVFPWNGSLLPRAAVERVGEVWTPGRAGQWSSASSGEVNLLLHSPSTTVDSTASTGVARKETASGRFGAVHALSSRKEALDRTDEAKLRELIRYARNKVLGEEVKPGPDTMDMGWILTDKIDPSTGSRTRKARWVARGYQAKVLPSQGTNTYAGTPDFPSLLVCAVAWLTRGWEINVLDVRAAFLQAPVPADVDIVVRIARGMPTFPPKCPFPDVASDEYDQIRKVVGCWRPGTCLRATKAVYGDQRAPAIWQQAVDTVSAELGYSSIAESVRMREESESVPPTLNVLHVDDFCIGSSDAERVCTEFNAKMECNAREVVTDTKPVLFTGLDLLRKDNTLLVSQTTYLKQLVVEERGRCRPVRAEEVVFGDASDIDPSLTPQYRHIVGQIGYATKCLPRARTYYLELARFALTPTPALLAVATRVLCALKDVVDPLEYRPLPNDEVTLHVYTDSSYSAITHQGRMGFKIFLWSAEWEHSFEFNLVCWQSKRLERLVTSSTAAELLALKFAVKAVWGTRDLARKIWGKQPSVVFYVDNNPLLNQIRKRNCGPDKRLQGDLDYVLQELSDLKAELHWVCTENQKADDMTKCVWFR